MPDEDHRADDRPPSPCGDADNPPHWQSQLCGSPPLEESLAGFWETGPEFESIQIRTEPPERPLALLEQLGPSPFERGGFPVVGFLATTYDKVSRYALERG